MFKGLCAFPLTPLAGDNVDEAALVQLVGRCVDAGADSIGVLGSTGVYTYLLRGERRKVVEASVEAAQGTPVVAGVGAMRTRDVLGCVEDAHTAGASGLLLAPVSYQRLTEEEVYGLYREVSSASDLPIAVYDNPATTGFTFSDELHGRIAKLPGIASIKFPPPAPGRAADRIGRLRAAVPGSVSLGISGDWAAAEALLAGCDVWYSVIAGLFPKTARVIVDLAQTGQTGQTRPDRPTVRPRPPGAGSIWCAGARVGALPHIREPAGRCHHGRSAGLRGGAVPAPPTEKPGR
jgi:4-hydroxy-tetrahydrodipicolinate synthase